MKIYFEDGELLNTKNLSFNWDNCVDARYGYSQNIKVLDMFNEVNPKMVIYTNQITALDNIYAWNEELEVPEIYIRAGEYMAFTRIDELTNRELRRGHNIMKMYISGEFSQ